jgi:hypothetical protein
MSHSKKILALFVVAVSAALATSLFHSEEATARDRGSIKAGRIDAQLTRLQVDVFELICPRERLIDLDLAEINRGNGARSATGQTAASAREVLDRLRQFGDARLQSTTTTSCILRQAPRSQAVRTCRSLQTSP